MNLHPCLQQRAGVVFRGRDTFTWIYTPASSSAAVLCLGVATRLHESTPLPPAARRVVFRCRDTFSWIYTPASSSAAVLECSKTEYHCSASSNLFMPPNEERKLTSFCHDRAPLSDSLLPLTATCGGLFTSCHRLPHVGEQSVLIHSTERSISLTPVTHLPFPIYSGLCPLSVSVCHLWFVLPVVGDLLSLICILCPGSPGEE